MVKRVDIKEQADLLVSSRRESLQNEPKNVVANEEEAFTRVTTIMRKEYMKKVKIIASMSDKNIKDVLDEFIGNALSEYESRNGNIITK